MKRTFNSSKVGAVAATLGMGLALGGASFAVAQTGTDIVSRGASVTEVAEAAGISPVIGKSYVRWAQDPNPSLQWTLPEAAPQYSQVNFGSNPLDSAGPITTPANTVGQMHAEGTILMRKAAGVPAEVKCDLRMDSSDTSNEYVTTIVGSGVTKVTMPIAGARKNVAPGGHNVGIRCWATGNTVVMEKADLHAVIYGASAAS
jgi:hypothetical protein